MKRLLATFVLTCALSGVSLGADIPTCGVAAPAPDPVSGEIPSTSFTSSGEIPTSGLSVLLTVLDLVF
jgi:hypothetical protein